jgi:HD-like signal output (HDOD) protein
VAQISDDNLHQYGIGGVRFRENSLFAAFLLEAMAPNLQLDPRAAYTAGLLRSTGKIAIDRLIPGPSYAKGYGVLGKGRPLDVWEQEVAGVDNVTAAGVVLEAWRFPELTSIAIRNQYRPVDSSVLSKGLNLACGLAEAAGHALPGEASFWTQTPPPELAVDLPEWELERCLATATTQFEAAREAIG